MNARRFRSLVGITCIVLASPSCKPADPEPPPIQTAVLNYTLLGIWPDRYGAYEASMQLKEAGIRSELSGNGPCALNVEADKIEQARAIVSAGPTRQQTNDW